MKTTLLSLSAAAFVAIGAFAIDTSPARAEVEYPWCGVSSVSGGGTCYFATLEQCQASFANGGGGFCQPNPRATAMASTPAPKAKHRAR